MGGSLKQVIPKSLPLQGWVTGKKSFAESLKTDGNPIEQRINRGVLKAFGGSGGSGYYPMTKGLNTNPQYFLQQQQMLANMRQQQNQKLANMMSQKDIYPTSISSVEQFQTSQTIPETPPVSQLAQSKVSDTNAPADMPTELIYKPASSTIKNIAANTFQMPDMSNIKFGGV